MSNLVGTIARVRFVDHDQEEISVQFTNGNINIINVGEEVSEYEVGSVVSVDEQYNVELAPNELWPEESWVGIVRLKKPDITVIDSRNHWRMLPTHNDVTYREGNTVEVRDSCGVVRVLSEKPIKSLDLHDEDDIDIEQFKSTGNKKESFEDFGGLQHVVKRAQELIEIPLNHQAKLKKIGTRMIKGVLFTGLPGTGKTMLARIIANQAGAEFYEISGPEIFSKWYGQSEKLLRKLFEHAGKQKRAIIFFDEIDSVAGKRDDNSHEASRRVVAQLLTLMDGFTSDDNIIVIAATNRPQDIDPALRRPGRFDWEVNFPPPDRSDREAILRASAQKLSTDENLPHAQIAQQTDSWSAAELSGIWSEAALLAVTDNRSVIMTEDYIEGFNRIRTQRQRIGLASTGDNAS